MHLLTWRISLQLLQFTYCAILERELEKRISQDQYLLLLQLVDTQEAVIIAKLTKVSIISPRYRDFEQFAARNSKQCNFALLNSENKRTLAIKVVVNLRMTVVNIYIYSNDRFAALGKSASFFFVFGCVFLCGENYNKAISELRQIFLKALKVHLSQYSTRFTRKR